MTVASTGVVDEEDEDCDYTVHWGAGHQGPAEAGTVPLGLVAPPAPALSDSSDCVLAESAEAGRVPPTEEASIQSEASSVPEWGAGHCHGTEEGVGDALSDAPGPRDAPGDAPGDTPGE